MQYYDSIGPVDSPGGGGWSSIVFNLGGLYQQFKRLMNWWTKDNDGLPLVQYKGCKFKFYKSWDTDYIVTAQTCPPMTDTEYKHLDSHPYRQLMNKKPIIVPNLVRKPSKKTYITRRFPPPSLLQNKWYFQQDLCNTGLLMLNTTAASFDQFWLPNDQISQVITFYSLNTNMFQNPNFHADTTTGYTPKTTMLLWGTGNGTHIKPTKFGDLHYLGNTNRYTPGEKWTEQFPPEKTKWGNPFFHDHSSEDTIIYYSTKKPTKADDPTSTVGLSVADHIYTTCRYNPLKDTGEGNKAYLINNSSATNLGPPSNENLIIEGFPLPVMLWGWTDFVKKLKQTIDIDKNYILVIVSPFFEEKLPYYIFLDEDFKDGFEPYTPHDKDNAIEYISPYNNNHWYPKYLFQCQSVEKICRSGPACPRPTNDNYLQAFYKYKFHFKWGGCPKQLAKAYDPCLQSKWPTPDNITPGLEISNPNEPPQTHLYDWDWEEDYIKEKALERIRIYTESPKQILFLTDSKQNPKPLQIKEKKEETENEEETQLLLKLFQLRHQRKQLELLLQSKHGQINIP